MSERGQTPFECANPILHVADMARSVRYYVDVLGFANAAWAGETFTMVTRGGAAIYLAKADDAVSRAWVWIGVEDVRVLHNEYTGSGATILQPPEQHPWAWEMEVADPDGHVLRFGSGPDA